MCLCCCCQQPVSLWDTSSKIIICWMPLQSLTHIWRHARLHSDETACLKHRWRLPINQTNSKCWIDEFMYVFVWFDTIYFIFWDAILFYKQQRTLFCWLWWRQHTVILWVAKTVWLQAADSFLKYLKPADVFCCFWKEIPCGFYLTHMLTKIF